MLIKIKLEKLKKIKCKKYLKNLKKHGNRAIKRMIKI